MKQRTARDRLSRSLKRIGVWCKQSMYEPVRSQWQTLSAKLRGHYGYFGITGNQRALDTFKLKVTEIWRKWLGRRSRRIRVTYERMGRLLERYPLPQARIVRRNWTPLA